MEFKKINNTTIEVKEIITKTYKLEELEKQAEYHSKELNRLNDLIKKIGG
tara:strand:+ start:9307 stop:9456 length:150 start_codon:yes stop_codon:yes gene_type:complete